MNSIAIDTVFPKIGKIGHFLPSIVNTKDFPFKIFVIVVVVISDF